MNTVPESIRIIVEALRDKKGEDVTILDVTGLVSYADYFIICTGNNPPHVQTLADSIARILKVPNSSGVRVESDQSSTWVLIDGGEFVLHIFQPKARTFYNIEDLWEDAPRMAV